MRSAASATKSCPTRSLRPRARACRGCWSISSRRCCRRSVIALFDATIEQMVALAVLMPIVASMGGNAGTQTMTVTVRALATRDLDIYNAGRVIRREVMVGLLNGAIIATILGLVAGTVFRRCRTRPGDRQRDGHQHADGGTCRHPYPAAARQASAPTPPSPRRCSPPWRPTASASCHSSASPPGGSTWASPSFATTARGTFWRAIDFYVSCCQIRNGIQGMGC